MAHQKGYQKEILDQIHHLQGRYLVYNQLVHLMRNLPGLILPVISINYSRACSLATNLLNLAIGATLAPLLDPLFRPRGATFAGTPHTLSIVSPNGIRPGPRRAGPPGRVVLWPTGTYSVDFAELARNEDH